MESFKGSIELAERITSYFKGMLSEEEETELKRELSDLPDGEKLLHVDYRNIIAKKEIYNSFGLNKNWKNIQDIAIRRSMKRRVSRVFRYAAVFILAVSLGAFLLVLHNKMNSKETPQYIVDAFFEAHKVTLELPGGVRIALDTVTNVAKELNEHGVMIEDDRGLDYSGTSSVIKDKVDYHRIIVPRGGEYNLKLADGTNVWMFAESEIRFPTRFKEDKREVYLSGEAYFEVSHNLESPFYVKINSLDIKVLGTIFNVKAYKEMTTVETSLVEGVISVNDNILRSNQQAVFHKGTRDFSYHEINGDSYRLRKEKMFVFDEERLDNILQEMARWYDFEIYYMDSEMASKRFGLKLEKYEHVESLLEILEKTGEVKFSMEERRLIVMNGKRNL